MAKGKFLLALLILVLLSSGVAYAVPMITGADVVDNSLTGADIQESTLSQVPSALNAVNATNATEAIHAITADKLSNYELDRTDVSIDIPAGGYNGTGVTCPVGKFVVSGGSSITPAPNPASALVLRESLPFSTGDGIVGWSVTYQNLESYTNSPTIHFWLICAS